MASIVNRAQFINHIRKNVNSLYLVHSQSHDELSKKEHPFSAEKCMIQIYEIGKSLSYSEVEVLQMVRNIVCHKYASRLRYSSKTVYDTMPKPDGRDNKDTYVGGGGSNRNKIRYPSKKRSKSTWKKFYALFPYAAERDNWDGNTSDKMK